MYEGLKNFQRPLDHASAKIRNMRFPWDKRTSLTSEQKQFWEDNGYLVLPGLFQAEEVQAVNDIVERIAKDPKSGGNATIDVLHGTYAGKRFRAAEAPLEAFTGPIKINDLFLEQAEVRHLALNKRLTHILKQLMDGAPMVCNSLNFMWGSQQPNHFDTWYMPPPVENKLAVSSICLEDVRPDAGPLVYYPGTHKIPPFRFSHGGIHAINEEMDACRAYVEEQLEKTKAPRLEFNGKAGDVFLWHGQLLHGGTAIKNPEHTRKTLVTHYWRAKDVEPERVAKIHRNGFYLIREHQATA
jgi:ectoine hydroxylase-related dioxygenase (phytanoyl-CoA dioxygenase family)